jgi:DNA-binding transcriptional LysR family regulator
LGQELFRRERNLTHLTEFGRRMAPFLQQCYDSAVAAKSLASSLQKGVVAPLSLAISHSVSLSMIMSRLSELARVFHGLELDLFRGARDDLAANLKRGEADLALCGPLGESWDRLESWPLFAERFHVAVGRAHRFAGGEEIAAQDLDGESLVIRTQCEVAEKFMEFLKSQEARPKILHKVASERDYLLVVESGLGVGLMPESAAGTNSFARVPVKGLELGRTVFLHAVAGRQRSPVVGAFMKLLRSADWAAQIGMR